MLILERWLKDSKWDKEEKVEVTTE
jgi:hypothetical protein